jgi:predicted nucleic acid-binding protein
VILVDSSVWVDYFRGSQTPGASKLDELLGVELVAVGDLIVTEVLQGFIAESAFDRARRLLGEFPVIDLCGRELAVQAARNHRTLKARGVTVRKTIDTIIATRCIEDGHTLLHNDRDFEPFVTYLGLSSVL